MVGEELGHEARRERAHLARVGRPHGRDLGHDQPLDERAGEVVAREQLAERLPRLLVVQQPAHLAVEAQQIHDHPLKARAEEVPRLAEQPPGGAAVLEVLLLALHREAHVRGLGGHAEAFEQAREVGVVAVVHHDEARVHVVGVVLGVHPHRVRVPAGVGVGLIHDDLVLALEQVRSGKA